MMDRIDHWVVLMFENRSFDSLLGHLPHIDAADGIRGRQIELSYPGGTVRVGPTTDLRAPLPDPGEGFGNVNAQLFNSYLPATNAGRSPYPLFPDAMTAPFNAPSTGTVATMDGFALDFYWNFLWEKEREPTDAEMQTIGGVFTPETAPVINRLASEYAVFTNWHCEAPTCTFPNRSFFHCGTSLGKLDNESIVNYSWDFDAPNLFSLFTEKGLDWKVYFDSSQVVPDCAINLAGLRHHDMWTSHAASRPQFFADAAMGTLPTYSWVEPNMMFGELDDYHPPTDIRAGERLLAAVYNAVRSSPQWESTALVVLFDEHGGCYDHVAPPAAVAPDDSVGEQGFAFDRLGVRVPSIVISPYTERGTVVRDTFHTCSVLHSLRDRFDLGPALTRRDAAAPSIEVAFNRSDARADAPELIPVPSLEGIDHDRGDALGDAPDIELLVTKDRAATQHRISQLGEATLRNAARRTGDDLGSLPTTVDHARSWLADRFDFHHA